MNCVEFEAELQRGFDRRTPADADALHEHRRTCESCRASWARARLLADAIAAWRVDIPDVDLVAAVAAARNSDQDSEGDTRDTEPPYRLANCALPPRNASAPARSRTVRALAVIAAIGAAIIAVPVVLTPEGAQQAGRVGVSSDTSPRPIAVAPSRGGGRDEAPIDAAMTAYDTFTKGAAGALEEFAWTMIPVPSAEKPPDDGREWIDGLEQQLRPIGQGLDEAVDFLWGPRKSDNSRT